MKSISVLLTGLVILTCLVSGNAFAQLTQVEGPQKTTYYKPVYHGILWKECTIYQIIHSCEVYSLYYPSFYYPHPVPLEEKIAYGWGMTEDEAIAFEKHTQIRIILGQVLLNS